MLLAMDRTKIESEGWRLASISSGEHLQRILEMYRELDVEVSLEEVKPEECGGCTDCYAVAGETVYRVYTRPKVKG